ncbi:MAG: hypothetical protein QF689_09050, partial [Candidatus Latescibacteria bacterium]|nr:hypothetical protein [Candidatus Latescibacterota bacterium]
MRPRRWVTLLLVAIAARGYGDDVEVVKQTDASGRLLVEYEVIQDSGSATIRHGFYRSYHGNGRLKETGQYESGSRTGSWKLLTPDGATRKISGYRQGLKDGTWTSYRTDGAT